MSEGTCIKAFMGNGKNDTIKLTIKSNHYEEGDRCALDISWINNLLEPLYNFFIVKFYSFTSNNLITII
jgi:hypothetical protein